jgi:hypothetical protein
MGKVAGALIWPKNIILCGNNEWDYDSKSLRVQYSEYLNGRSKFKGPQRNLCVAAICYRTIPWREHHRIRVNILLHYNTYFQCNLMKSRLSVTHCKLQMCKEMHIPLDVQYSLSLSISNQNWNCTTVFCIFFKYYISWKSVHYFSRYYMCISRHKDGITVTGNL